MRSLKVLLEELNEEFGLDFKTDIEKQISSDLPVHILLANQYKYTELYGENYLLADPIDSELPSPKKMLVTKSILEQDLGHSIIFVLDRIDSYRRKQFIKNRISFITRDKQIFLPSKLISFKKHLPVIENHTGYLSPAAQVIIIFHLNKYSLEGMSLVDISNRLGYSAMTITRAVRELESIGLCSLVRSKSIRLSFHLDGKEIWEVVKTKLKSPVKKVIGSEKRLPGMIMSGMSALSEVTNIAPDGKQCFGILDKYVSDDLKKSKSLLEDSTYILELWKYNPQLLSKTQEYVDPFSLYLSLIEGADERTKAEIETLIEKQWLEE